LPEYQEDRNSREHTAEIPKGFVYYLDKSQRPLMAVPWMSLQVTRTLCWDVRTCRKSHRPNGLLQQ